MKACWKEDFPLVKQVWVRKHLDKLDINKCMGSDGKHPQMLKELVDTIASLLIINFERS